MFGRAAKGAIGAGLGLALAVLSAGAGPALAAPEADHELGTFTGEGSVVPDRTDRKAPAGAEGTDLAQARASRPFPARLDVRVQEHAGFSRLVFDWMEAVDYRVAREDGSAVIRFDRAASIDMEDLRANLPKFVAGVSVSGGADGLVVRLAVNEAARLRHYRTGTRVVVDVLRPVAAARRTAKPARPLDVVEAPPPAPAAKPPARDEVPASKPVPQVRVEEKRTAGLEPAGKTHEPGAAGPTDLIGPRLKGRLNAGPVPVQWGKARNLTRLSFGWREQVGAAVFTRAGFLWVVFDREASLDLGGPGRRRGKEVGTFEQRTLSGATVARFELASDANPVVRRDGTAWIVELVKGEARPSSDIRIESRVEAIGGPRLFLDVAGAGNAVEIRDPEVGDKFWAVPVAAAGRGVGVTRVFAELQILATAQGVAISPLADGVKIRTLPDGIELAVAGGLILSGNGPPPVQQAEKRNDAEYEGKTPAALSHTDLP